MDETQQTQHDSAPGGAPGAVQRNRVLAERWVRDIIGRGNLAAIDELVAPAFRFHNASTPDLGHGPEAVRRLMAPYWAAFPDLRGEIHDVIATEDKAVIRASAHGTHSGPLMGIPATGRRIEYGVIAILQIADGQIAAHWDEADIAGLVQQIGALPAPAERG
jgi:steroid delta-isomerase-like uncharacterized protein